MGVLMILKCLTFLIQFRRPKGIRWWLRFTGEIQGRS
ncbi:hypothetical protein NC651_037783 [Populus alba x Populus x berolinensis]|nr:hypothetical protein NC651_037783 [Populus alba x Populus x berolinensis]